MADNAIEHIMAETVEAIDSIRGSVAPLGVLRLLPHQHLTKVIVNPLDAPTVQRGSTLIGTLSAESKVGIVITAFGMIGGIFLFLMYWIGDRRRLKEEPKKVQGIDVDEDKDIRRQLRLQPPPRTTQRPLSRWQSIGLIRSFSRSFQQADVDDDCTRSSGSIYMCDDYEEGHVFLGREPDDRLDGFL